MMVALSDSNRRQQEMIPAPTACSPLPASPGATRGGVGEFHREGFKLLYETWAKDGEFPIMSPTSVDPRPLLQRIGPSHMNSIKSLLLAGGILGCMAGWADEGFSRGPVGNSVQASVHASASAAHAIAASGQTVLAVSAVPLSIGGAVLTSAGQSSTAMGNASMQAANAPIGTPLPITDEAITVVRPDIALRAGTGAPPPAVRP